VFREDFSRSTQCPVFDDTGSAVEMPSFWAVRRGHLGASTRSLFALLNHVNVRALRGDDKQTMRTIHPPCPARVSCKADIDDHLSPQICHAEWSRLGTSTGRFVVEPDDNTPLAFGIYPVWDAATDERNTGPPRRSQALALDARPR
jgi:hypothetical protein